LPHYGNATEDGMPAGQNGRQSSRNESHVAKDGRQSKGNKRRMSARKGSQLEKMEACLGNMEIQQKKSL
jgi:hypothetical protein